MEKKERDHFKLPKKVVVKCFKVCVCKPVKKKRKFKSIFVVLLKCKHPKCFLCHPHCCFLKPQANAAEADNMAETDLFDEDFDLLEDDDNDDDDDDDDDD